MLPCCFPLHPLPRSSSLVINLFVCVPTVALLVEAEGGWRAGMLCILMFLALVDLWTQ